MDQAVSTASTAPPAPGARRLSDLRELRQYQAERADVFPSLDSARWAIRRHRAELAAAGALVKIADRLYLDPQRADQVFIDAGRRRVAA